MHNKENTIPTYSSIINQFLPLFMPQSIAVVGASATGEGRGNTLIRRIQKFGYVGKIFPIHPSAEMIDGLQAYPNFSAVPDDIDYAYIAIPGKQIIPLLAGAAGRVRYAQVISSGFGEIEGGHDLQDQLVMAARQGGARLIGPNCLGLYTPRGGVTFTEGSSKVIGGTGVVSQSGGLGIDIIRRGLNRGLRFSGLVTVGNCADIESSDLLEFYLADEVTKVVGMYIETAQDGRRLFDILRNARARKPVIIMKGGRSRQGKKAAASHTGSLAGDERAWAALARQTGCTLVNTLEQFIDVLLAFQTLRARPTQPIQRVVLFGNGGGTSVLATDYFADLDLDVEPFEQGVITTLAGLGLPPGASFVNPVDCPMGALQKKEGRVAEEILDVIYRSGKPDALVMHVNLAGFAGNSDSSVLDNLINAALRTGEKYPGKVHFMLVLRSDGDSNVEERKREFREKALKAGVPVYDEISNAGHALAALKTYEWFMHKRGFDLPVAAHGELYIVQI